MKNPISKKGNQFYVNPTGIKGKEVPFNLDSIKNWSADFKKEFATKPDTFQIDLLHICFLIAVHELKPNEDPLEFQNGAMEVLVEKYPEEIESLNRAFNKL